MTPAKKEYRIRKGTHFGPVVWEFAPIESDGVVDIAHAEVRVMTADGVRVSTEGNSEVVVDAEAQTVTWELSETATAELTGGPWSGAVVLFDSFEEDREPVDLEIFVEERL